jgi:hypothetical protein
VGNGSTEVGNKGPTRNSGGPRVERPAGPGGFLEPRVAGAVPLKSDGVRVCVAMSQQHGDDGRGNLSAPQKFVRLVGCHDPKARTGPWVRPRPAPPK